MPIRFNIDGIEYTVDTKEELRDVLDVTRSRVNGTREHSRKRGRPAPRTSSQFELPWIVKTDTEREMWKVLIAAPDGISGKELAEAVGIKANGLQGVMTNMSRRANKAGVKLEDYVTRDRGEDDSTYVITDKARHLKPEE
jgi:hypothetical protein